MPNERLIKAAETYLAYAEDELKLVIQTDSGWYKMKFLLDVFSDLLTARDYLDEYEEGD